MIRLEVVLKNRWGTPLGNTECERRLKTELLQAVNDRAQVDDLEIVRIQFHGTPPKRRRKTS